MRVVPIAVCLLPLLPCLVQAQDPFGAGCKPGRYEAAKGIGQRTGAPECYTSQEMIRALRDRRSFPVILATPADSKATTSMFTFNPQSHEGYELLLNAPVVACSQAQASGLIDQCLDPSLRDAFGATQAIVVDSYDQAQFMDIAAKGARSFGKESNVMFRARSQKRDLAFVVAKTHHGAAAGTGFQSMLEEPQEHLSSYEFIDYTNDGKALLGTLTP